MEKQIPEETGISESTKKEKKKNPLPRLEDTSAEVPPFAVYFDKHIGLIKEIQGIMQENFSPHPGEIEEQTRKAEGYYTRSTSMLAWADSYLDLAERQRLVPYDRGSYTDKDRDIELAAACSRERRFRDVVQGIVDGVDKRISLGQSLLKYHEERLKRGA